jgi:hypothetical protein
LFFNIRPAGSTKNRATCHPAVTLRRCRLCPGGRTRAFTLLRSLNGEWQFQAAPNPASAPQGFESPDFDAAGFDRISVPGNWQLQGDYDIPIYVNVQYPFPVDDALSVPHDDNPTGSYRRTFTCRRVGRAAGVCDL